MDFTEYITSNHIEAEKAPAASSVSDAFSNEDAWAEEGEATKLVSKVWMNLGNKIDNTETITDELAMMSEFILNHLYNRHQRYKDSSNGLERRAASTYFTAMTELSKDIDAWHITASDMKAVGEYLKVANAVSTKFTGDGYDTAMYLLTTYTIELFKNRCDERMEKFQSEKGLFNRGEMNEKIESWDDTKCVLIRVDSALEAAWDDLHTNPESYFN